MTTYFIVYVLQATLYLGPMTPQACDQMVSGFNSEPIQDGATAQCELRSSPPSGKQESAS